MYKKNIPKKFVIETPTIWKKLLEEEKYKKNKLLVREYFLQHKKRIDKII